MRKGYTLVEILAVMVIIPFVLLAFNGLFRVFGSDVPRSFRLIQEHATLLDMLQQLEEDVQAADELPQSAGNYTANDTTLLVETDGDIVCYRLEQGRVLRFSTADAGREGFTPVAWRLPNAQIQWKVWRKNGHGYAVQLQRYIEYGIRRKRQKKLANAHLYFVGTVEKAGS